MQKSPLHSSVTRSSSPNRDAMDPSRNDMHLPPLRKWYKPFWKDGSGGTNCISSTFGSSAAITHAVVSHGDVTQACQGNRGDLQHRGKAESYLIPQLPETLPELPAVLSSLPAKIPTTVILHAPSSPTTACACQTCVQPRLSKQGNNAPVKECAISTEGSHGKCRNTNHSTQSKPSQLQGCFSNNMCFCRRTPASRALATLWQKHGRETCLSNTGNL